MSRGLTVMALVLIFLASTAQVHVKQEKEEEARSRLARELAVRMEASLPGILERFAGRRRALRLEEATATYPAAAVGEILALTEAELESHFDVPDFAPLRVKVAAVFHAARLDLQAEKSARHALPAGPALAAWVPAGASGDRVDPKVAGAALDRVRAFLLELLDFSRRQELVMDLCLVSRPRKEARFDMNAPGYPEKGYGRRTPGKLVNVFRGMYAYGVDSKGVSIECRPPAGKTDPCLLDLWLATRPTFDCDFELKDCSLDEGWPPACNRRGR